MTKNSDLAEEFAEGKKKGKGNHMFIEGNTIYSYGHHFPIATITGDKEVEFNEEGYSRTTAKHKGYVKRALQSHGYKIKKMDMEKRRKEEAERAESRFQMTANVARLGDFYGKDDEEKAAWKQRMIKAGIPEIEFPEGWEKLPASERNARMNKVLEAMEEKQAKKKSKKMKRL